MFRNIAFGLLLIACCIAASPAGLELFWDLWSNLLIKIHKLGIGYQKSCNSVIIQFLTLGIMCYKLLCGFRVQLSKALHNLCLFLIVHDLPFAHWLYCKLLQKDTRFESKKLQPVVANEVISTVLKSNEN